MPLAVCRRFNARRLDSLRGKGVVRVVWGTMVVVTSNLGVDGGTFSHSHPLETETPGTRSLPTSNFGRGGTLFCLWASAAPPMRAEISSREGGSFLAVLRGLDLAFGVSSDCFSSMVRRKSICSTHPWQAWPAGASHASFATDSKTARGESSPGDGKKQCNMAGDSGGVFGVAVAVGEGGSDSLDKNRALRSTCVWNQSRDHAIDCPSTHAACFFGS